MINLFVYGTLMDEARVVQLTGRRFRTQAALLRGYRKEHGASYPYLVDDPDGTVQGLLLYDVDADSLRHFDTYEDEGHLYKRVDVIVTAGNAALPAATYVGIVAVLR